METKILLTFNMSYKNIHDIQMNKIKTQFITKELTILEWMNKNYKITTLSNTVFDLISAPRKISA